MNGMLNNQINAFNFSGQNNAGAMAGITSNTAQVNSSAFFTLNNAKTIAQQFSKQVINKAVLSIGSRTGNYVLQERVQSNVDFVTRIAGIGLAFATNPILGAFTLASEGIGLVFDIAERNREVMWQNRAASELARRAGYLSDQNR